MNHIIQRTARVYLTFANIGASLSMIVLFTIVFINSIRRYTIGKSLEWGEELPIYIAIFGVMFGIARAYMEDRHVRFTMLLHFLPSSWINKIYLLVDLIMVVNGAMLAWSGWMFAHKRGGVEASGIINLAKALRAMTGWEFMIWIGHQYPYQAAMVMGGVMLAIAALLKFLLRLTQPATPESIGG